MKNWETFVQMLIPAQVAREINTAIKSTSQPVLIPKGRVLMATVEDELTTNAGLIIPMTGEDTRPKFGVIIHQQSPEVLADGSDEVYCDYDLCEDLTGHMATVGLYSGKEVYLEGVKEVKTVLQKYGLENKLTFKVISASEIAMIQPNYR